MMYIDTSLLVAYYVPEAMTDRVDTIIAGADKIYISSLTKIEVISALNKKVRIGDFTNQQALTVLRKFEEHLSQGLFSLADVTSDHYQAASDLLIQTNAPLRTLDAIHLGVVQHKHLEIASNDSVLVEAAKECNIPAVDV